MSECLACEEAHTLSGAFLWFEYNAVWASRRMQTFLFSRKACEVLWMSEGHLNEPILFSLFGGKFISFQLFGRGTNRIEYFLETVNCTKICQIILAKLL